MLSLISLITEKKLRIISLKEKKLHLAQNKNLKFNGFNKI